MGNCPSCGEEIDHLQYHEEKNYDSEVELEDGKLVHTNEEMLTDNVSYSCPLCGEDISMSEDDAIRFLGGA